ncbi:hypothetical protein T02_3517, partial [Trichinella nativa]
PEGTLIVIKPRAENETAEKGGSRTHGARHQLAAQACTSKNYKPQSDGMFYCQLYRTFSTMLSNTLNKHSLD